MCDLKSRGMSVVCTWELRGIFFLTLVLFVLFSHGAMRCAALFSYVCTVCTISNTPNFTNCVRTSSDHLPSHIFPRESEKKSFGSTYTKKNRSQKNVTKHNSSTPKIGDFHFRRWWPLFICDILFAMKTSHTPGFSDVVARGFCMRVPLRG